MGFKDLIITPVYLVLFTSLAYLIRPYFTNNQTKKYFLPALWVRFAGAIALGFIYQLYYKGGDTFNYWEQSEIVSGVFFKDPILGLKLLLAQGNVDPEIYPYISKIYWFKSPTEYFIVKISATISLFTFKTYSSTALFFAFFSFAGSWMMFSAIQYKYPKITKLIALSVLFIPSCIFWGTSILKDTVTLGSLGLLFWSMDAVIERRRINVLISMVILFSSWLIYSIKIYILICLIPSVFIWWYLKNIRAIRNTLLRIVIMPLFLVFFIGGGYLLLGQIASSSERYSLDSLAEWSYITSYDIRYYTGKDAGSGYDLGAQDGSWSTLLKLLPSAVNVSLFRPYLWEVKNPLMLFSALEAMLFLWLTVRLIPKLSNKNVRLKLRDPLIVMMLCFSLSFAFAVGVSTYNFGSLSRYKIPLLPFYITAIIILYYSSSQGNSHTHPNRN